MRGQYRFRNGRPFGDDSVHEVATRRPDLHAPAIDVQGLKGSTCIECKDLCPPNRKPMSSGPCMSGFSMRECSYCLTCPAMTWSQHFYYRPDMHGRRHGVAVWEGKGLHSMHVGTFEALEHRICRAQCQIWPTWLQPSWTESSRMACRCGIVLARGILAWPGPLAAHSAASQQVLGRQAS